MPALILIRIKLKRHCSPSNRRCPKALFWTNIGLGKTIEAGLLLTQYWAERKRKLLIIVPASLRTQWSAELREKLFKTEDDVVHKRDQLIGRVEKRMHHTHRVQEIFTLRWKLI